MPLGLIGWRNVRVAVGGKTRVQVSNRRVPKSFGRDPRSLRGRARNMARILGFFWLSQAGREKASSHLVSSASSANRHPLGVIAIVDRGSMRRAPLYLVFSER